MRTSIERTLLETICTKIGAKCHVSRRTANLEFLPFLKIILSKKTDKTAQIAKWLKLDSSLINYLRNRSEINRSS